ncbi:hypothetical protein TIFTF001_025298 [Ficus carica]|uniref:GDSL esterase/lipase n=1 Tax=Ficus carica TaxID=3494 RepID=A0AA88ANI5_FICCA|nr:hypothetical protein TIFTF001_025298 [Ficus carica]
MDFLSSIILPSFFLLYSLILSSPFLAYGQLVPAMFLFGDSVVDVGNNNGLSTLIKSNFPPYGRDFFNHRPTGRFSNGKLATDFVAEALSFTSYQPAYLGRQASGKNLLIGANFASAASGYFDETANLFHTIPLSKQLDNYKEYQGKVVGIIGAANATSLFASGIYLISAGSSDFVQNYYINPLLYNNYTPEQFTNILMQNYEKFIQELYGLGARRIGVNTLPPIGCLPASITLFGSGHDECVRRLNHDAQSFNAKLTSVSQRLQNRLSDLKLVVLDIYKPLYDIVTNPSTHGFSEARRGCCGTGLIETSILCNPYTAHETCANATEYVFWDSFHPSEAANQILSDGLINAGLGLIS